MELTNLVSPEIAYIIPALWVLGAFLKKTPKVADFLIIWILLCAGIVLSVLIVGFSPDAVVQGFLAAGVAVMGHQLIKQTTNK